MTNIRQIFTRLGIIFGWAFLGWLVGYIVGGLVGSYWDWLLPTIGGIAGFIWGIKSRTLLIFL